MISVGKLGVKFGASVERYVEQGVINGVRMDINLMGFFVGSSGVKFRASVERYAERDAIKDV